MTSNVVREEMLPWIIGIVMSTAMALALVWAFIWASSLSSVLQVIAFVAILLVSPGILLSIGFCAISISIVAGKPINPS